MNPTIDRTEYRIIPLNAWDAWPLLERFASHIGGSDLTQSAECWRLFLTAPRVLVRECADAMLPIQQCRDDYGFFAPMPRTMLDDMNAGAFYLLIWNAVRVSILDPLARDRFRCTRTSKHSTVTPLQLPPIFSGILAADPPLCTLEQLKSVYSLDDVLDLNESLAVRVENEWLQADEVKSK